MDTPTPDDIASDVQQRSDTQLKRGLASRHMQMIAIGGAIGTGLFLASGATVANAGPGGALLAYAAIGLMVLLLMQSLGEMSAHQPVAGSFQTFATKFISPSFGFAMGWNYWFNWAVTVAADLVASGLVMAYWFPSVPSWIWAVVFLVIVVGLNALSARVYGEAEFWKGASPVVQFDRPGEFVPMTPAIMKTPETTNTMTMTTLMLPSITVSSASSRCS